MFPKRNPLQSLLVRTPNFVMKSPAGKYLLRISWHPLTKGWHRARRTHTHNLQAQCPRSYHESLLERVPVFQKSNFILKLTLTPIIRNSTVSKDDTSGVSHVPTSPGERVSSDADIPHVREATRLRRRNMEAPSSYVPEAPPARPAPDLPDRVGTAGDANKEAFSVKAINTHFRTEGREIGTKTNQRAKQGTISRQFGPPNSGEKSGSFARFMEFLGPRYLEDARELLGRNTLRRIETEMTKKHKKYRKPPPGQSEFIQLSTMVKLLETVLIVLREYPPFDALCRVPGKSDDDCEEPAQESVKKRYEEIDALFNKYDAQVNAANLAKPKEGVRVLPFKEIKRRVERAFPRNSQEIPKQNLYINMYAEFVSRDDMKNLKLSTERPPQIVDALKRMRLPQNTLYVSKKSAVIALVDYKTSNLYGPQRFEFSERVSQLIWEYIKLNKLLETDKTSGILFGKSGTTTFVGNMLDAIGQPQGNEGAINVLRKSYVSSEMDKAGAGMTADERQALLSLSHATLGQHVVQIRPSPREGQGHQRPALTA
jgi:hypothetical protein